MDQQHDKGAGVLEILFSALVQSLPQYSCMLSQLFCESSLLTAVGRQVWQHVEWPRTEGPSALGASERVGRGSWEHSKSASQMSNVTHPEASQKVSLSFLNIQERAF